MGCAVKDAGCSCYPLAPALIYSRGVLHISRLLFCVTDRPPPFFCVRVVNTEGGAPRLRPRERSRARVGEERPDFPRRTLGYSWRSRWPSAVTGAGAMGVGGEGGDDLYGR